jgi:hypothetical protein
MKWVTRERPKTDRIACPWLILNFIEVAAFALLFARYALSQMDVPTRQAYVVGVVDPNERTQPRTRTRRVT